MNSLKIILGIALTLAMSGCGLARVYNKIELGEPLPSALELVEIGPERAGLSKDEHFYYLTEYYVWHTPLTTSNQTVAVWTDADDNVIGCVYSTSTFTNLLLLISGLATNTADIIIPSEAVAKPQGMTLSQIMGEYSPGCCYGDAGKAGHKAIMRTAGFPAWYYLGLRNYTTWTYAMDIPLSSVLEPGYDETIKVHSGGHVTLTNRGNNQLRIVTHVPILTDPLGLMIHAVFCLEHLEEESAKEDE